MRLQSQEASVPAPSFLLVVSAAVKLISEKCENYIVGDGKTRHMCYKIEHTAICMRRYRN